VVKEIPVWTTGMVMEGVNLLEDSGNKIKTEDKIA